MLEKLLGIKLQQHRDGPQFGYFWRNAITPDWCGPEGTPDDALRAAGVNLLFFARIGRAFDLNGAVGAQKLLLGFDTKHSNTAIS